MNRDEAAERGFPTGPAPLDILFHTVDVLFAKVIELEKRVEKLEENATKIL